MGLDRTVNGKSECVNKQPGAFWAPPSKIGKMQHLHLNPFDFFHLFLTSPITTTASFSSLTLAFSKKIVIYPKILILHQPSDNTFHSQNASSSLHHDLFPACCPLHPQPGRC